MESESWTVKDHLREKPDSVVRLYEKFARLVEACGPVVYSVSKTAITFKGMRRGFAGAKPTNRSLDGYLDLQRQVKDPRIPRAEPYTKTLFVHHFRVTDPEQLDDQFAGWIHEAYEVGQGRHLRHRPRA